MKDLTIKELRTKFKVPDSDIRDIVKAKLLNTEHVYKKKAAYCITPSGADIIQKELGIVADEVPLPIDSPSRFEVKVHQLPPNQRLVLIWVGDDRCRAIVKPHVRKTLAPGNAIFVEHMEGDLYQVVPTL